MAVEPEMIEGVKKLLAEGHKPENVKENLAKLGYTPKEAEGIMKQAQAEEFEFEAAPGTKKVPQIGEKAPPAKKGPIAAPPVEQEPLGLGSEEDMLLQSAPSLEVSPEIEDEAESLEMGPSVAKPMPPPRPAYAQKAPLAQEEVVEEAPKKRTGATLFIVLVVIVVLGVLAVTIALPKLGINLL